MEQKARQQALDIIRDQHKMLLLRIERPEGVDIEQVRMFLNKLAQAGAAVEGTEDRALLHELLRYWSSIVNDKTGKFPAVQLRPFDQSLLHGGRALVPEKSSHRVPTKFSSLMIRDQDYQLFLDAQRSNEILSSSMSRRNRRRILERVHSLWITGVLEQSLRGVAPIVLELKEQPGAVANPWKLAIQEADQSERSLPSDTDITQFYDTIGGELLILGEPGSGKTTLMLQLTRDLLNRAFGDDSHPIPTVFNLSSWALKRQPLDKWLVEELNTKYQVPLKLSEMWVENDSVLPLLDGLDEVASEQRTACVEAINFYRMEHGLIPTVVCSRSVEYLASGKLMLLQNAVVIQAPTAQKIYKYLESTIKQPEVMSIILQFGELLTTPVMLNLIMTHYCKLSEDSLHEERSITRYQVLEAYVKRTLHHHNAEVSYTSQQTMRWLAYLARQLTKRSQTVFYIELMQPDWLGGRRWHRLYWGLVRFLVGLTIGLSVGVLAMLLNGIVSGLISAVIIGLSSGLDSKLKGEIKPVEKIAVRSWKSILWGFSIGLLGASFNGVGNALLDRPISVLFIRVGNIQFDGLASAVLNGLISVLISWLVLRFGNGWSRTTLDEKERFTPNQGIWRSARNAVFIGLIDGLGVGLASVLGFGLGFGLLQLFSSGSVNNVVNALDFGIFLGLLSGLLAGLSYGGLAYLQHFMLRLLLWFSGSIPWNYVRFLNFATEHALLRKVGGGYIFSHRLLLYYFASLDPSSVSDTISHQTQKTLPAPDEI